PVGFNPCGIWLASDGGLTADLFLADELDSNVGAAEGCDLLMLIPANAQMPRSKDRSLVALGSSYRSVGVGVEVVCCQ
ncbi:hypothetical protein, partial [Pseudomonas sp. SM4]|uniref:hypothetical protein n=1 Tax=Pseudomonas sp. SM4 TaxID=3424177 RepID=UPI003F78D603